MLAELAEMVNTDGGSYDKAGVDRAGDVVARFHKANGLDVEIVADQAFHVSDRLAAEVFQIVNEGMSNMRKHTTARGGRVVLARDAHMLTISIENERAAGVAAQAADFMPVSITERTQALGGTVQVGHGANGATLVRVDIPV